MRGSGSHSTREGLRVFPNSIMLNFKTLQSELLRERQEMLVRIQTPMPLVKGDEADLAVMSQAKERALWLVNDARQKLIEIDQALLRIELGTYGACAQCGNPIPDERLKTIPLTLFCVHCASLTERDRKK